jgi:hypothetical protein
MEEIKNKNLFILAVILDLLFLIGGIYAIIQFNQRLRVVEQKTLLSPLPDYPIIEDPVSKEQIERLQNFFNRFDSPLATLSATFITASEAYNLDWRLLPAIAGVESTFGKYTPSCAPYNPFGWSSTTSPCGLYRFSSFGDAVWHLADRLSNFPAYSKWRETGEIIELAKVFNGSHQETWARNLNYFLEILK